MPEGFSGYPEWERRPGDRLTVSLDIETYSRPNHELGVMETEDAGRRRIVIEGEAAFVNAIYKAAGPAIDAARVEIGA